MCLSFERFGEGSDKDRSFEKGNYFRGPMYKIDKTVYESLFGRKGAGSLYGLMDMSGERIKESRTRGVTGNFAGDGFVLGGSFVVDNGAVTLDSRQRFYGDDASPADIETALK